MRINHHLQHTVGPGYNDIGLSDTLPVASDILQHQLLIPLHYIPRLEQHSAITTQNILFYDVMTSSTAFDLNIISYWILQHQSLYGELDVLSGEIRFLQNPLDFRLV
jgi:hypothetical protein